AAESLLGKIVGHVRTPGGRARRIAQGNRADERPVLLYDCGESFFVSATASLQQFQFGFGIHQAAQSPL
ncbi:MAG TPA: hypothetical protein VM141_04615, partial [Planctomycetota bacterium]|nr:hypothetical protein [Planctomycetota bacterium]